MGREEDLEAFKNAVEEACTKYGFSIGGCGCCGSPSVVDERTNECVLENYNPAPRVTTTKRDENASETEQG